MLPISYSTGRGSLLRALVASSAKIPSICLQATVGTVMSTTGLRWLSIQLVKHGSVCIQHQISTSVPEQSDITLRQALHQPRCGLTSISLPSMRSVNAGRELTQSAHRLTQWPGDLPAPDLGFSSISSTRRGTVLYSM